MAKMPPQFLSKKAPAKTAGKAPGKAPMKTSGGKMCPGCKDPACKKAGKCAK